MRGQSALVQYAQDGLLYRSRVDVLDITEGACPVERLRDAPHGIDWKGLLQLDGLAGSVHEELTSRGIWTLEDLQQQDRVVIRIATNTLGRAIWDAARRGCGQ